jgi:hypothetical protein
MQDAQRETGKEEIKTEEKVEETDKRKKQGEKNVRD